MLRTADCVVTDSAQYFNNPLEETAQTITDTVAEHPLASTAVAVLCELCDWVMTVTDASENGVSWYHFAGLIPAVPGVLGRTIGQFDIVTYGTKVAKGLEKHHGVLDMWAASNVSGYKKAASGSPTIVLSAEAHAATKAVYNQWAYEKTGKWIGPVIDWTTVSKDEVLGLAERMFDAAGVLGEARQAYYDAFEGYVKGLGN